MVEEIKLILYNDKNKLIKILENLGCHKINPFGNKEIRCALPTSMGGQTNTSVQIILNEFLPTYVHSRGEYDDYGIKDIISFVQFILKCNFRTAVFWLCEELGIKYDESKIIIRNQSETIQCLQQYARKFKNVAYNEPMSEEILNQYPKYIVQEWVEEGINKDVQDKYDIRIDEKRCRWLIPIRDENNNLVSIKGRTYLPNYKELNIPKYIYYKEDKDIRYYNNILFGLNYHYENIKKENEVILFEGEKSVMKAEGMGFYNCVSIGKDGINPYISPKILKLHTDVVIALDKDVLRKNIIKECRKLSIFTNVYYIYDENNLLDINKKDSPVDKGFGVFLELYSNKKRIL